MNHQVGNDHYSFTAYVDKRRWMSVWYQIREVLELQPSSVLEIGPGPGLFKTVGRKFGLAISTIDIDPELRPDIVGSALNMPFPDCQFDAVCAFQVLEHFPLESSITVLREASRVAKRFVVLTLPDARKRWNVSINISKRLHRTVFIPRPWRVGHQHMFDGQHYWEVNKAGYELRGLIEMFSNATQMRLAKTYRFPENDYHRLFLFERVGVT